MSSEIIRQKFIRKFGQEKYKQFVLTIYESFPRRANLFFWQEQLLDKLSKELNRERFEVEEVFTIFNHCPVHDVELKEDIVPVIDGNNKLSQDETELFPLANTEAPRNLDFIDYPKTLHVFFCPKCRDKINQ